AQSPDSPLRRRPTRRCAIASPPPDGVRTGADCARPGVGGAPARPVGAPDPPRTARSARAPTATDAAVDKTPAPDTPYRAFRAASRARRAFPGHVASRPPAA